VYNSETNIVEELIHVKFDEKEHDNKMSKLVESFVEFQITEEASAPNQAFEALELVSVSNVPKMVYPLKHIQMKKILKKLMMV
jgi:hypothetical protein